MVFLLKIGDSFLEIDDISSQRFLYGKVHGLVLFPIAVILLLFITFFIKFSIAVVVGETKLAHGYEIFRHN